MAYLPALILINISVPLGFIRKRYQLSIEAKIA